MAHSRPNMACAPQHRRRRSPELRRPRVCAPNGGRCATVVMGAVWGTVYYYTMLKPVFNGAKVRSAKRAQSGQKGPKGAKSGRQ
eukprot:2624602-Prymnesium_polylepis.2